MIDGISGLVKAINEQRIAIDIGALCLSVHVPQAGLYQQGEKVDLYAHLHWNQEQGPSLYGFSTELERSVFLMVTDCSGVGPRLGLAILADLGAQRFLEIVQAGDERGLSKVSGIGPKKAEQLIVQLKHKVAKLLESGVELASLENVVRWQTVSEVLQSLNYSRTEISGAIKYLRENQGDPQIPFDRLIRQALSFLAKKA